MLYLCTIASQKNIIFYSCSTCYLQPTIVFQTALEVSSCSLLAHYPPGNTIPTIVLSCSYDFTTSWEECKVWNDSKGLDINLALVHFRTSQTRFSAQHLGSAFIILILASSSSTLRLSWTWSVNINVSVCTLVRALSVHSNCVLYDMPFQMCSTFYKSVHMENKNGSRYCHGGDCRFV